MGEDNLEQRLQDYRHFRETGRPHHSTEPETPEKSAEAAEEGIAIVSGNRVVYFREATTSAALAAFVVPGIIVKERHRKDETGNEYSLVAPLPEHLRPELEDAVWFSRIREFGTVQRCETVQFTYW